MFVLSKLEWLALAVALLLCPGSPLGAEPVDGRISRSEFKQE